MVPVLAYWDIRGLAQPIRLLLEHCNAKYEDKYYVCGEAPGFDKSCWFDVKFTLGLDFPNLPYYISDSVKLTESGAILRHLARKHDLCGKTEEERCRMDVFESTIGAFRMDFVKLCYMPNFEENKVNYLETLPKKLKSFEEYLGTRKWFAGDNLTFVDFIAYEMFDQHLLFEPKCLEKFPSLTRYTESFRKLPNVAEYLNSSRCIVKKLNNRMANFGSGVDK